jgi:hypothetical protein
MISSKKLFELVINNNYEELETVIQNKQVDFIAENKRGTYIIPTAIEYRAIECFDLLINNISEGLAEKLTNTQSGMKQALDYYNASPNIQNKYFIEKLLNKNIIIKEEGLYNLVKNIKVFDEFSEYILNDKYAITFLSTYNVTDTIVYETIFSYCLKNNLLTNTFIKDTLRKTLMRGKDDFLILVKNTHFINNIWELCPDIISLLISSKISNTQVVYFVNKYKTEKPTNVNYENILKETLTKQINISDYHYYNAYCHLSKKDIQENYKNISTLFTIDEKYNLSEFINNIIQSLIINPYTFSGYGTNKIKKYILTCAQTLSYYISLIILYINNLPSFELNIKIDNDYLNVLKNFKGKPHQNLIFGLKALTDELIRLNKTIPDQFSFITNDDEIIKLTLLKLNNKTTKKKKEMII